MITGFADIAEHRAQEMGVEPRRVDADPIFIFVVYVQDRLRRILEPARERSPAEHKHEPRTTFQIWRKKLFKFF